MPIDRSKLAFLPLPVPKGYRRSRPPGKKYLKEYRKKKLRPAKITLSLGKHFARQKQWGGTRQGAGAPQKYPWHLMGVGDFCFIDGSRVYGSTTVKWLKKKYPGMRFRSFAFRPVDTLFESNAVVRTH